MRLYTMLKKLTEEVLDLKPVYSRVTGEAVNPTYNKICTVVSFTVPKSGLYLLIGDLDSSISNSVAMRAQLKGATFSDRQVRATMESGGGLCTASIHQLTKNDVVELISYGVLNRNYTLRGGITAIRLGGGTA